MKTPVSTNSFFRALEWGNYGIPLTSRARTKQQPNPFTILQVDCVTRFIEFFHTNSPRSGHKTWSHFRRVWPPLGTKSTNLSQKSKLFWINFERKKNKILLHNFHLSPSLLPLKSFFTPSWVLVNTIFGLWLINPWWNPFNIYMNPSLLLVESFLAPSLIRLYSLLSPSWHLL